MTRTPHDTFLSDQALALARDIAATGTVMPVVIDHANGEQCSWCDCPDGPDSPHNVSGYRCSGCPQGAYCVVRTYADAAHSYDYPACERHKDDIVAAIASAVGRGGRP